MQDYSIDLTKTVKTSVPAMKNGMGWMIDDNGDCVGKKVSE